MRRILALLRNVMVFGLATLAHAETWRTQRGETFEAKLNGVYGPLAVFAEKGGTRQIVVEALDDAGVARIADFIAGQPANRSAWNTSSSPMAKPLRGKLGILRDAKLVSFDLPPRPEPEIYLVFYGAGANDATRRFMPLVVARYTELKKIAGDRFELIYLGRDGVPEDHTSVVRESRMPWPFVRYSAQNDIKGLVRWAEQGIPSLVALTPSGDVVIDSIRSDGIPLSPDEVLNEFGALLSMMAGESAVAKRGLHRLAVVQHVRARASGEYPPKPYVLSLDRSRYQTLPVKTVIATLQLDEQGRVTEASFEPGPGAVLQEQFQNDARTWLFLPKVVDGKGRAFVVKLPIEF
jgi:hypothetical protein